MYEEYFLMLYEIWQDGWYAERPSVNGNWLKKTYPSAYKPRFISIAEMEKLQHNL